MSVNARDGEAPVDRAAAVVARQLRRRIVRGELAVGDTLPGEADLIAQFQVSRPTLREAIRILESESLVTVKRGARGGIEVSVPQVEKIAHYAGLILEYQQAATSDVFLAAAAIEGPCVAMVARSRTAADLKALRAVLESERSHRSDPGRLLDQQNDFHRVLIEMAGNETLLVLSDVLRHIIEVATQRYVNDRDLSAGDALASRAATRTHERVVQLIADRDAAAAEALWRKHILATSAQLRASGVADSVVELLE